MGLVRLTSMKLLSPLVLLGLGLSLVPGHSAQAQMIAGPGPATPLKDPGVLISAEKELPAGHKIAIVEFEDLECPACAHAAPIVKQAIDHYHVVLERHDFLIQGHAWSKDAAIIARYLQDKVSPDAGEQYRRDVFANQSMIASKDDLNAFTRNWFTQHHLQMPFVIDPNGLFAAEVQADVRLGERLGLNHTPTIFVIGPKGYTEVTDASQLYTAIDNTLTQQTASVAHNNVRKSATPQR